MRKFFLAQILVLAAGVAFAWYTVSNDFWRFYDIEGTVFRVKDCAFPNPVTTPCFWGAVGFVVALGWAVIIYRKPAIQKKQQKFLMWFLVAGTIFGWSNFSLVLYKFLNNHGQPTIGCSGQLTTNPFTTPCFIGSVLFAIALLAAIVTRFVTKKNSFAGGACRRIK